MASSSRGGCRHGSSILRAYYVKVVRSWNAARHDSFLRRLSPRFRTNTLKAPPTLAATAAPQKLARFFQPRSLPSPSARYQIRNPTRDNPSLTSGSEIFLLFALLFSSLLTLSPSVNRDAARYHPRLTVREKKAQSPSTALPSIWAYITQFFYSPFYGRACSSRCLLSFKNLSLSFYLSQIITLAKMSRDVPLSHAVWAHALSRYITSHHVTSHHVLSRRITESSPDPIIW